MDKPEEVKRFDLGQQVSIGTDKDFCKTVMIGVIEGKYVLFEDHAKALSAEREKRELVEKSLSIALSVPEQEFEEVELDKMLDRAYLIGQGTAHSGKILSKEDFLKTCKEGFK